MNTRFVLRTIPSILVVALLALAAAAPGHNVAGPAPPPQWQPCEELASAVVGDSSVFLKIGSGLEQAFPAGMCVAACSLRVVSPSYYGLGMIVMRAWDPTTLAPDPSTIALRTAFYTTSDVQWSSGPVPRVGFLPPVVTASEPGVAEPLGAQVAIQFATGLLEPELHRGYFNPDGPAELPEAVQFDASGARSRLTGNHPVLANAVCAGDTDLAKLRIAQSVMRTDVKPSPAPREFAQRFRVPQRTELRWIELAFAQEVGAYLPSGEFRAPPVLAIVDGADLAEPMSAMPQPMVEARFDPGWLTMGTFGPFWVAHVDLDRTITLESDHDYWIWVRESSRVTFFNRRLRGDESPEFKADVGPYYCRADSAGAWNRTSDQVLAFRVVGLPTAPAAGPVPPPATASFALQASPNPATGFVRVDWSGAVAPVNLQVFDERGRRVAEASGGAAGSWTWKGTERDGSWTWKGTERDGRAMASGIYFVHARDSNGRTSVQRAVVVR